ncbi:MAG: TlyA family RNA methyltransferase [Actinobacteria bacterium]|nr:TlyA family RNA methyltransferase [Actinomycetota bacterium]
MAERLDELLVRRGLFPSRAQARAAVLAGEVRVAGTVVTKAGYAVPYAAEVAVAERRRYVSRGGDKLAHALDALRVAVAGESVCDLGSSTGGFVDCLLQHGAARVAAVDVGYGQLDWRLRQDPRVHVLERTNARDLRCECLPFAPTFVTADLSFISLTLALGPVLECARPGHRGLALVKPQFEAGRDKVGKGGVVRDPAVHRDVLERVAAWLEERGAVVLGVCDSGYPGPKGNVEFFISFCDAGSEHAAGRVPAVGAVARAVEAVGG